MMLDSPQPSINLPRPKNRTVAIALAFAGLVLPGLHKFYLGQTRWGIIYGLPGLVWITLPIATLMRVASLCDALIYLSQGEERFHQAFNSAWPQPSQPTLDPMQMQAIAASLRQLESLRQEGLVTDYEFEQQRRQLLG
ncbi:MAG: NINE protein [Acaryochloris sp. RU_4_1]|nr:NINE protein [Acaryochloris sp. RU_4_1]NJR55236.1 NINE protein [Acaryochloris sp. CRU_2_0]